MIVNLHISNYALIPSIDIEFGRGFNIMTGETGAGKSIILGALSLILGGRADTRTVRDATRKTVVEAVFHVSDSKRIDDVLKENDVDSGGDECILRREITVKGGSRAFINDTPVTLPLLRRVAMELIDIHSQHQNLLLADNAYQLSIIDSLADNGALLADYAKAYAAYRDALREYTRTRDMLVRNKAEGEYLAFQLSQLDELNLKPGEQEALERDRDMLANMTEIKGTLTRALDSLESETPVTAALARSIDELQRLSEIFDDASDMADRLRSARLEIQDIVDSLLHYNSTLSADPAELENVENRLSDIYSLEAKHHVDSDVKLMELREQLRRQLDTINNGDEALARLEESAKKAKRSAVLIARELSARRTATAAGFASELKERAKPLGMNNIRCEIVVSQGKLGPSGADNVDFLFAFNKNQPLMPVGKTASGGEISRVILAIKSIVVEKMHLPTVIFDEVDTGVSGEIANRMADVMKDISRRTQVITITHLPQVAARGNRHFKVYKEDVDNATVTGIALLDDEGRENELALMLGGSGCDEAARANARALLQAHSNT